MLTHIVPDLGRAICVHVSPPPSVQEAHGEDGLEWFCMDVGVP